MRCRSGGQSGNGGYHSEGRTPLRYGRLLPTCGQIPAKLRPAAVHQIAGERRHFSAVCSVPPPHFTPPSLTLLVVAGLPGRHRHVQVLEDGASEGGLRPLSGGTPALFPGRTAAGLRAADAGNLRFRRVREDQNLEETSTITLSTRTF